MTNDMEKADGWTNLHFSLAVIYACVWRTSLSGMNKQGWDSKTSFENNDRAVSLTVESDRTCVVKRRIAYTLRRWLLRKHPGVFLFWFLIGGFLYAKTEVDFWTEREKLCRFARIEQLNDFIYRSSYYCACRRLADAKIWSCGDRPVSGLRQC